MTIFGYGWPVNAVIFIGLLFGLNAVLWAYGEYLERRRR